ncbi:Protein NO VEIN (Protein EMBRYO DEFECTIVE 2597) [Durusdinium trenchii]|uniref:Protein NO VEIN (Protein EMBRYO DEFECTIVE 2597) n=1 Tax=Durusdinium trenchii TaxID=1381693 RepID=A0ABP0QIQ8_9DINO
MALRDCTPSVLRSLHWALSASEDGKRQSLLRPLVHEEFGQCTLLTLPKSEGPEETTTGRTKPQPKKARIQKSQIRLQSAKGLQSPLHWICAHDVLETGTGECLGGWPSRCNGERTTRSAGLARSLARQWPEALLLRDTQGLWPLSYFETHFCEDCLPHSPQRELLVSLLQSLRAWAAQDPEALLVALDPQALRSLASALTRVEAEAEASGERAASQAWRSLWELTGEAAHRGRRCAALEATELRQDAELWRQRGEVGAQRDQRRRVSAWTRSAASMERLAELHAELGRLPDGRVVAETARPSVAVVASPELPEEESRAESGADAEGPQGLIASLRRHRIGCPSPSGGFLRSALGAAVERLAVDLYEMESHFVYELLQNADDNGYAEDTSPWLKMELHQDENQNYFFFSALWQQGGSTATTADKLRTLLQLGGASFYDAEGYFVKTPMVSLVAVGGLPLSISGSSLQLRLGELRVPVPLESIRSGLKSQMGMTAMFSYLNRRGLEPEEMWDVVQKLGHFSVGHTAHLSFVLAGHSCAVENEFNSQRDVVHLGRLTVARTRSQKDPPLVVQRPELLPVFQSLQKLTASIDDDGKETEYRALLWQIAVNNELGLTAKDVRALCDVNASSKMGRENVTGHKGIGWKSCFQVSDCPHMLSGSFTFKFDVKKLGKMGYVTPTWVHEEELHQLPPEVWEAYDAGYTVTYLPLRPGTEEGVELALADLEEHLPCLLFLRRLQRLEFRFPPSTPRSPTCDDRRTSLDARWVSFSLEVHGPGRKAVRASRAGGDSWRTFLLHHHQVSWEQKDMCLTLAFPIAEDGEQLMPQALYCLLPVRNLGFAFCIDGPFELIASRGDLHEGSWRNQVLCEALPHAFANALEMHPSLAPHALAFLGHAEPSPFWQAVHARLLEQMHGTACVPLEDGGLDLPENCLLRPGGGLALGASRLVPAELLLRSCGKRWARATTSALGLEEIGLEHWLQILRFRDSDWPKGLCGSWLSGEGDLEPFRTLFGYLGELLAVAEDPSEVLQLLWDLELLPVESQEGLRLFRPRDRVCSRRGRTGPAWAWQRLEGQIRVLSESLTHLDGPAGTFLHVALEPLEEAQLKERLLARLAQPEGPPEVQWAALAVLQSLFLETPWEKVNQVLWLPSLGEPRLFPAHRLVMASFLGCALDGDRAVAAAASAAASGTVNGRVASSCAAGLPLQARFVDPEYLSYGDAISWESFLEVLGVRPLYPIRSELPCFDPPAKAPAVSSTALPQVESASKSAKIWAQRKLEGLQQSPLGEASTPIYRAEERKKLIMVPYQRLQAKQLVAQLVSAEWWRRLCPQSFDYLLKRLKEVDSSWLRSTACGTPPRPLAEYLIQGSELAQLCGPFLPVAALPETRSREVRQCLSQLGLLGDVTPKNLLRCLEAIAQNCQDVALYVALYQRLALYDLEEHLPALSQLIFVPGHGILTSEKCAWRDSPLMQLAEVPALSAHYERHGPRMEAYFLRLVKLHFSFSPPHLLHALRRLVERVNSGDSAVPGQTGLDGLLETATGIYSQLAIYLKDHQSEATFVLRSFRNERLVLLRPTSNGLPKRLMAEECWWQVGAELAEVESVQKLALCRFYSSDLQPFFLAIGVHEAISRAALRKLLQRPAELTMSKWSGLDVSEIEDLGLLQTSSHFRPPDWHAPDASPEPSEEEPPGTSASPPFQPPRRSDPHVPAMRTREELERLQREEEERSHAQRSSRPNARVLRGLGSGGQAGCRGSVDAGPVDAGSAAAAEPEEGEGEDNEGLEELQRRLQELQLESRRQQQESFELRSRWAQAEDDAERYMKILREFWAADESLRTLG